MFQRIEIHFPRPIILCYPAVRFLGCNLTCRFGNNIYLHLAIKFMVHVGKYTSPMDP